MAFGFAIYAYYARQNRKAADEKLQIMMKTIQDMSMRTAARPGAEAATVADLSVKDTSKPAGPTGKSSVKVPGKKK